MMIMRSFKAVGLLFLFVSGFSMAAPAESSEKAIYFEASGGSVEFLATGRPGALKIRGKTAPSKPALMGGLLVTGLNVTGEVKYPLDSLETGIEMRDHHMKEKYLETAKYPQAEFKMGKMTLPEGYATASFTSEGIPFEGTLTLHGQTKPVSGKAKVVKNGEQTSMTFVMDLLLSDYGIAVPSFMGVTVASTVAVSVDVSAKGKPKFGR